MEPTTKADGIRPAATHDFSAKLRQPSLFGRVAEYVAWQRALRAARARGEAPPAYPDWAPLSINLDLTTACNYRCDHCIDWDILNKPIKFDLGRLFASLDAMAARGLKSVILIGGGEPTLHPAFVEVVQRLKQRGLSVAVVTNGSRTDRLLEIADLLDERDWIRLSLDAGTNETFVRMHKPVQKDLTLEAICADIPELRARNPKPRVGFSFVITWEGARRDGETEVVENIDEIVPATRLAKAHRFSYISLKPFLTRRGDGSEVLAPEEARHQERTLARIRREVDRAKTFAGDGFEVVESINLLVLEHGNWRDFTRQPRVCHMQALRQVLTPMGLFNCPAHRGVEKAKLAGPEAFAGEAERRALRLSTAGILERFDASRECAEVTCLYHPVNWWLERAIEEGTPLEDGPAAEREDWFL